MTPDLIARLRSIADASRRADGSDIPLGEQVREAADALETLMEHAEALAKALALSHALLETIEQRSACNTWWVNADDPETACGDTYHAVGQSLAAFRAAFPGEG